MTDILSLLAQSTSKPSASKIDQNDQQWYSPKRNSPSKSPFQRNLSKEKSRNGIIPGNNNHTLKVHKSIAEDIFKGYPVYQKKTDVSPFRQRLNYHNETVKQLKYTPQKQMKTQVQKYIEIKGSQIQAKQPPQQEDGFVRVGNLGVTNQIPKNQDLEAVIQIEERQSKVQLEETKSLINLQRISNQPIDSQPINSQYQSQNYQSSSHYRSRSQTALKALDLQSTQWLLDHKPIYLKQRQGSVSSMKQNSPSKNAQDESKDKLNSSIQNHSIENDSLSTSLQSSKHSFKPINTYTNGTRALKSLSQVRTQRKLEKGKKVSPRNSLTQTQFLTIKESVFEERQSDAFIKYEQYTKQNLSIAPIQENLNQRESWMCSQIHKEKAKLGKDYTQYLLSKYQKQR